MSDRTQLARMTALQALSQPNVVASFIITTCVFWTAIAACRRISPAHFAKNSKALAWLPSLLVSATFSIIGTPSAVSLWTLHHINSDDWASHSVSGIFLAFLVVDTTAGITLYPNRMQLVSGYIHHAAYLLITLEFLRCHVAAALMPMSIMELPTFLLALGNVVPSLRSDLPFGIAFFATRIVFHIIYVFKLVESMPHTWFPIMIAMALPMHVFWFTSWLKSYRKKHSIAFRSSATSKHDPSRHHKQA